MAKNTFNAYTLNALQGVIVQAGIKDVLVKRSAEYEKAVVVGRAGKRGSLMISQLDDDTDRSGQWFVSTFEVHHPKEVADGEIHLASADEDHFETWHKLTEYVVNFFKPKA